MGNNSELKQDLLKYFHSSTGGGHSGVDTTTRRIVDVIY